MNQTPHHFNILKAICAAAHLFGLGIPAVQAAEVIVRDDSSLRQALRVCEDQTVLKIGPGQYSGGYSVREVKHLTVEALDSKDPPKFVGGNAGWHFSSCPNLTLRHLHISGQQHNGLNIDDGGQPDRPATDITLEKIEVSEIGPKGNCDGIKCSGLDRLTIRECSIRGWGGQAIDLVGCHDVLIALCHFEGKEGFTASAGVQAKGGRFNAIVEQCEVVDAGGRAINGGGSTGLEFFRPHGS